MCVAVYKPIGVELPTKEELYNCYLRNQDGAGFAFYRNGKINIKKGVISCFFAIKNRGFLRKK